jgi:hypothetical protein
MPASLQHCLLALLFAFSAHALPAAAQGFDPGSRYICPNHSESGLECYLDAVKHLYTMCRHVKSIEIIEFGYEAAQQGVNGAKSEYCVNKQKINITRPYQAALREVTPSADAVNGVRQLNQTWQDAMAGLTWRPGESDEAYKERVAQPYVAMTQLIDAIRASYPAAPGATGAQATPPAAKKSPAKTVPAPKAQAN